MMTTMTIIIKEYFYYLYSIDEETTMREIAQSANTKQPMSGRCGVHTQVVWFQMVVLNRHAILPPHFNKNFPIRVCV